MTSKNKKYTKSWSKYTDKAHVDFAKSEYRNFDVDDKYIIGEGKDRRTAGYVRERVGLLIDKDGNPIANHDGEQAYNCFLSVPKDQVKHVGLFIKDLMEIL